MEKVVIDNIVEAVKLALAPEFNNLNSGLRDLKEDVSILKEDVSVLKEDVSTLKEDVSGLKEDVVSLKAMDHAILGEVVRVHEYAAGEINKLHKQIQQLMQYYHIAKTENNDTTLLIQRIDDLTRRVEVLEHQTA